MPQVSVLKNLNYMYIFLMYVYSQQFLHDFAKTCCESCADQVGVGGSGPSHPAEIQLQLKLLNLREIDIWPLALGTSDHQLIFQNIGTIL